MDLSKTESVFQLKADVEAIVLAKAERYPSYEDASPVLFVRPCIRRIFQSIRNHRSKNPHGNASVVGQPGIGKSYALFYFVHRFLKEGIDDADVVVLENSEEQYFYFFYRADYDTVQGTQIPREIRGIRRLRITDVAVTLVDELMNSPRVVYLVDMGEKEPQFRFRSTGYSVFSSSPGPYVLHLRGYVHKLDLQQYAPSLWTKEELKAVYDGYDGVPDLQIHNWKKKHPENGAFDLYYDTFGGTVRPLNKASTEFFKMNAGSRKLEQMKPDEILRLLGPLATVMDSGDLEATHALFAEVGGLEDDDYLVSEYPTKRVFRSKFAEFWFKKYLAPRMLFKAYTADVLQVLYDANRLANGSERGSRFEDVFHKLLPLGKWAIEDVPLEAVNPLESVSSWLAAFFNAGPFFSGTVETVDFRNIPQYQRTVDEEIEEEDLSDWDSSSGNVNTEANRRDVGHLIKLWNSNTPRFYWTPLGSQFPGLDSICRDQSRLYFVQVKTGEVATNKTHSWIDGAFEYTERILQKLGNPTHVEVTILLGTEPAKPPVLGKRKRQALERSNYPKSWKIRYLPNCVGALDGRAVLSLNESQYESLATEFRHFLAVISD